MKELEKEGVNVFLQVLNLSMDFLGQMDSKRGAIGFVGLRGALNLISGTYSLASPYFEVNLHSDRSGASLRSRSNIQCLFSV